MQNAVVPFVGVEECVRRLSSHPRLDQETQLCAGVAGRDSCAGDSGGPLMLFGEGGRVSAVRRTTVMLQADCSYFSLNR